MTFSHISRASTAQHTDSPRQPRTTRYQYVSSPETGMTIASTHRAYPRRMARLSGKAECIE